MVSSTPRPHFTPGKVPVPILQEAGWAQGTVWTGGKSRPHRDSISDRPARSQSLYRLSYPAHISSKCLFESETSGLVNETSLVHDLFLVYFVSFIYNLYMFRTSPGPLSGGTNVFMQDGVLLHPAHQTVSYTE